jgi:hypothetical protein
MQVEVREALDLMDQYRALNKPELDEIEFYMDGSKVEIDPKALKEFCYLGLNNTDFIRWYFGKENFFKTITLHRKAEDEDGHEDAV